MYFNQVGLKSIIGYRRSNTLYSLLPAVVVVLLVPPLGPMHGWGYITTRSVLSVILLHVSRSSAMFLRSRFFIIALSIYILATSLVLNLALLLHYLPPSCVSHAHILLVVTQYNLPLPNVLVHISTNPISQWGIPIRLNRGILSVQVKHLAFPAG